MRAEKWTLVQRFAYVPAERSLDRALQNEGECMPIAAKFSEDFYERFGHRATGELVDYLNRVDSDYRSELERLNDANWARLEARIEGFEAKLNARIDRL